MSVRHFSRSPISALLPTVSPPPPSDRATRLRAHRPTDTALAPTSLTREPGRARASRRPPSSRASERARARVACPPRHNLRARASRLVPRAYFNSSDLSNVTRHRSSHGVFTATCPRFTPRSPTWAHLREFSHPGIDGRSRTVSTEGDVICFRRPSCDIHPRADNRRSDNAANPVAYRFRDRARLQPDLRSNLTSSPILAVHLAPCRAACNCVVRSASPRETRHSGIPLHLARARGSSLRSTRISIPSHEFSYFSAFTDVYRTACGQHPQVDGPRLT